MDRHARFKGAAGVSSPRHVFKGILQELGKTDTHRQRQILKCLEEEQRRFAFPEQSRRRMSGRKNTFEPSSRKRSPDLCGQENLRTGKFLFRMPEIQFYAAPLPHLCAHPREKPRSILLGFPPSKVLA